ncbi:hypothetical protein ACFPYI_01905 [Halomarina salina]|uniref:Uncharacterized protein n=1 Tax=Halomarina salina TaxID=1872699 RepID=A0ABD5RIE1_9EURY|nr:hypothetical protein [Halomarina salina]
MARTNTGERLAALDDAFEDWFETALTVRNYVDGGDSAAGDAEYGDTSKTLEETIQTHGQVEQPQEPVKTSTASGQSTTVDAEILLPDEVDVYDGREGHPYPSEIETPAGVIYHVTHVFDELNGRLRVYGIDSEEGE